MIPAANIQFLRSQAVYLTLYDDYPTQTIPRNPAFYRDVARDLMELLATPVHHVVVRFAGDIPAVAEMIESIELTSQLLANRAQAFPELDSLIRKWQGPLTPT